MPFHRPPLDDRMPRRPTPEPVSEEPIAPARPPLAVSATSAGTGLLIAAVLRQPLLALFGVVTAATTLVSWAIGNLGHRRRHRRWRALRDRVEAGNAAALDAWRLASAAWDVRRNPSWSRLAEIASGSSSLWSRRSDQPDAWSVAIDVDERIDLSAGRVVGLHGATAERLARAMAARLAVNVGPSDVNMVALRGVELPDWPHRRALRGPSTDITGRHAVVFGRADELSPRSNPWRVAATTSRVSIVMIGSRREDLAADCDEILDADRLRLGDWSLDRFVAAESSIIEALKRWSDPDDAVARLPTRIGWLDRGTGRNMKLDARSIRDTWSVSRTGLPAVIGKGAEGTTTIDLVLDGPHAVVVGTTGSGKSGLLRALVLGLAVASPPWRLNFVLVDFKGGAAFDGLAELPHVLGSITDLDADHDGTPTERMLSGLLVELRRRERLLREIGVADIQQLPVDDARLARLVIVVDEAAAVRERHPDFVDALVAVAQRGRSLGLHLVLGTQRLAGVVGPDVLANCNLRMVARVQSPSESIDAAGSPIAAGFPPDAPGRLVVSVGGSVREVSQAFAVDESLSDVVAIVRSAVADVGPIGPAATRWVRPPKPWSDPLPERIDWGGRRPGSVGVVADADRSAHQPAMIPADASLVVFGPRNSGRTNALRTVVATRAETGDDSVVVLSAGGVDEWRQWERAVGPSSVARLDDRESVLRFVRVVAEGDRRVLVVVDGIDTWRQASFDERVDARLWDEFDMASRRLDPRALVVSTLDESSLPVSCRRHASLWRLVDPRSPGRFVDHSGRLGRLVLAPATTSSSRRALPRLPEHVNHADPRVIGVGGLSLDDIRVAWHDVVGGVLVVGASGSGRSTALRRLSDSWRLACDREPLVVDDAERVSVAPGVDLAGGAMTFAAVSPGFLRARPDHWTQILRRSRTGLLLGSAGNEPDLVGGFDGPADRLRTVFRDVPGRGVWVIDGVVADVVQVAR